MVRETSQWEREEMEKVVSKTKNSVQVEGRKRGKMISVLSSSG